LSSLKKVNQAINKALLNPDVQRQLAGADILGLVKHKRDLRALAAKVRKLVEKSGMGTRVTVSEI